MVYYISKGIEKGNPKMAVAKRQRKGKSPKKATKQKLGQQWETSEKQDALPD